MPKRLTCELFFDVVSPYTHFALHVWSRYAQIWPVDLKLRPMLLGGVMKATGNSPPGTLPQRAAYLQQDLRRNAALFAVDILPVPNNFISEVARAVVHVQRVLCAAQASGASDDAATLALALGFSRAIHAEASLRSEGGGLDLGENVMRFACEDAGVAPETAAALLQAARGDDAKAALRRNTDEAVERGVYGSPTAFLSDGERDEAMVFGSDRFEQLAHHFSLPYFGPDPARARL